MKRMKNIITGITSLFAMSLMTLPSAAQTFEIDRVEYTVVDGGVEVTKAQGVPDECVQEPYKNYYICHPDQGNMIFDIPARVTYEGNEYTVIGIGAGSFVGGYAVVTLPETIRYIKERAFCNSHLVHINLPEGLETIGDEAFKSSYICDVQFPSTLRKIGNSAFRCGLREIVLNEGLEEIGDSAFISCHFASPVIPESLTKIGVRALKGTNITSFDSGALTTLPEGLFERCIGLRTIILREPLAEMGSVGGINSHVYPDAGELPPHLSYYDPLEGYYIDYHRRAITADFYVCSSTPPIHNTSEECNKTISYTKSILHVPAGTAEVYRNADGWSLFTNIVDDLETALPARERLLEELKEISDD